MLALLQTITVGIFGFLVAVFSVFGLHTEQATAPSDRMPAVIQEIPEAPVETTVTTPAPEKETPVAENPKTEAPKPTVPSTPNSETAVGSTLIPQTPTAPLPVAPTNAPSAVNEAVRKTVVNIFCTSIFGGPFDAISASGVMIDPRGIILTNAHVAQYFLLRDYPTPNTMSCVIRTGAPAIPQYTAELMFLPPSWIQKNAQKIKDENPLGTGEHDYALVRITGTINKQNALPSVFPYSPISTALPKLDDDVLIVGYPAGFLGGIALQRDLYQSSAFTKVRELLTFVESTLDVFSIGGSVVAQSGSSGGSASNLAGELIGLIVTTTAGADTSSRDLRAITTSYILRDFQNEAGVALGVYLSGDPAERVSLFRQTKEVDLIRRLTDAIEAD
ncbi:trypsin-like peptidase domain-containing protein [Patescibacteria group bacterium]|nr:trypsin-like peptidase domain-containing protein [Patescibacteria group bacterium]